MGDARYADPGQRYVARFATPWRRAAAAAVDWGICYVAYLLVSIPLGAVQALGAISAEERDLGGVPGAVMVVIVQVLAVLPPVVYFSLLVPTSQTLGLRWLDARIVSKRTGRAPSRVAAALRGVVATAMAVACYVVFVYATSFQKPEDLDRTSTLILDGAYVVAAAAAASALVMAISPTRRSILDRVFGTVVVDELEAVESLRGPWGPLDAFDTSHARG